MKKIFALLLAVVTAFSMIACGGDKYADLKIGSISGFGQNLVSLGNFDNNLSEVDNLEFVLEQLKIDKSKVNYADGKPEVFRAMASPEEVLVIGAKDAASAKEIANGPVADWAKYLKEGYSDYGPEEVPKIESCVKTTAGRYVFLIISKDNEKAKSVLTDLLDTSIKTHE